MEHSETRIYKNRFRHAAEISFIFVTGLALGYLAVLQAYSVEDLNKTVLRDRGDNVFREMQIVYTKNRDLKDEIRDLENTLEQYSHNASYLSAVEEEVARYQRLAGLIPVKGPGVVLTIEKEGMLEAMWFVDLVNELLNGGAEAISVNNIRIVDETAGFDTLPEGQIFLKGSILSSPYSFKVIGPRKEVVDALNQPGGVLERLKNRYPNIKMQAEEKELIEMDKVV